MQTDETQDAVNNILNQLKNFDAPAAPKQELIAPGADELEEFVIKKSSELIDKSLQVLDEYRDFLTATPSEESAEAMSNLINASSSAIETLNKVLAANKRAATSVKIKEMDIKARVDNNKRDNATRLMMTRRELMQMLVDAPDAIDVETQKIED
jgi:hypothetical protein